MRGQGRGGREDALSMFALPVGWMPQGREGGCGIHTKDFVERKVWVRQEREGGCRHNKTE